MHVTLADWGDAGLDVLRRGNTASQKQHIGGPETDEQVLHRHQRYLLPEPGVTEMFLILADGQPAGAIGYWEREWDGKTVYETGWEVLPAFQGKGLAGSATRLVIEHLRQRGRHEYLHAYPSPHNAPSNAICRRAGFELLGVRAFEYPPGTMMEVNDWQLRL